MVAKDKEPMKRIRRIDDDTKVYRVSWSRAEELVKKGGYVYTTRSVWKKAGRSMEGV